MCSMFRLIFIDLQNVGFLSAAPCIRWKEVINVTEKAVVRYTTKIELLNVAISTAVFLHWYFVCAF